MMPPQSRSKGRRHRVPLGQARQSSLPTGGKDYLSVCEYLRKAGPSKTVNSYYRNIHSTHPSVATSDSGDEELDNNGLNMLDAVLAGDMGKLTYLVNEAQARNAGACVGERLSSLMLHLAAERGHTEVMQYLIKDLWVDVNACTIRGMTATHYAAKANRVLAIRELIAAGAELDVSNDCGQSPAQMTRDRVVQRLFDRYDGSMTSSKRYLRDYAMPLGRRPIDYVCLMKLTFIATLRKDGTTGRIDPEVVQLCRVPDNDLDGAPFPSERALADVVVCGFEGIGPGDETDCGQNSIVDGSKFSISPRSKDSFTAVLTDGTGRRSYACCHTIGAYTEESQKRREATAASLGANACGEVHAEFTAHVALVLSHQKYLGLFCDAARHLCEIASEAASSHEKGLLGWSLAPVEARVEEEHEEEEDEGKKSLKTGLTAYANLPAPLSSAKISTSVLSQFVCYGDSDAAHSAFPFIDNYCLETLFGLLSPDNVVATLECLLQEQSVLLLADDISVLTPSAEALVGLLYPFEWPHSLIPTLPISRAHYLEAPVPFLMGLHCESLASLCADLSSLVLVNLATNRIILPIHPIHSMSNLSARESDARDHSESPQLEEIPDELRRNAIDTMLLCLPSKERPPLAFTLAGLPLSPERSHSLTYESGVSVCAGRDRLFCPGIRVAMVDVMLHLIGKYQTFRYATGAKDRLIQDLPALHRPFVEAVISTQLWQLFRSDCMEEKLPSRTVEREEEVQLFCECVEATASRNGKPERSCGETLYPHDEVRRELSALVAAPNVSARGAVVANCAREESRSEIYLGISGHPSSQHYDEDGGIATETVDDVHGGTRKSDASEKARISFGADELSRASSWLKNSFSRLKDEFRSHLSDESPKKQQQQLQQQQQAQSSMNARDTDDGDDFWNPFGKADTYNDDQPVPLPPR